MGSAISDNIIQMKILSKHPFSCNEASLRKQYLLEQPNVTILSNLITLSEIT
jgi:hypothetical protein